MKIYTKFGDKGSTRLIGGECVDKSNPRVECYGDVDELNSQIGVVVAHLAEPAFAPTRDFLFRVQNQLFNLGALLACSKTQDLAKLPAIHPDHILAIENQIDEMTAQLEPLRNFILPGGSIACAHAHVARTTCRRAERSCVALARLLADPSAALQVAGMASANTDSPALLFEKAELAVQYLNRLSDYLFTLARFIAKKTNIAETQWQKE